MHSSELTGRKPYRQDHPVGVHQKEDQGADGRVGRMMIDKTEVADVH